MPLLLTDEQLHEIQEIIAKHHAAIIFKVVGPEVLTPDEKKFIKQLGLDEKAIFGAIKESYLYGQLMAKLESVSAARMTYDEFKKEIRKNPIPLSAPERFAVEAAQHNAGMYIRHLGSKVVQQASSAILQEDQVARAKLLEGVQEKVSANIVKREGISQLKSALGHLGEGWDRDWMRVAVTEKQFAMQQGVADAYVRQHGGGAYVFKRPMPDACFVAGTKILTRRGEKPIEEVRIGDEVLTHSMRWLPVTETFVRDYDGLLYGFDGPANMTANHPVLVDLDWRRADTIQFGDHVVRLVRVVRSKEDPAFNTKSSILSHIMTTRVLSAVPVTSVQLYRYLQKRDASITTRYLNDRFEDGRKLCNELRKQEALYIDERQRFLARLLSGVQRLDHVVRVDLSAQGDGVAVVAAQLGTVRHLVTGRFRGKVYNLEVEEDHSYFADGLAVHNCNHCKRLHLGPDGHPRIFRLSYLQANGTNVGTKAAEWKAVVGPVHPWCHPSGTKVVTSSGQKNIEELENGELVLTLKGTWEPALRMQRLYIGTMVAVRTEHGFIEATAEHPLLTSRGWVAAKSLELGDDLLSILGYTLAAHPMPHSEPDQPTPVPKARRFGRILFLLSGTGVPATAIDFDGMLFGWEGKIDSSVASGVDNAKSRSGEQIQLVLDVDGTVGAIRYGDLTFRRLGPTPEGLVCGGRYDLPPIESRAHVPNALSILTASLLQARLDEPREGDSPWGQGTGYFLHGEQFVEVHPYDLPSVRSDPWVGYSRILEIQRRAVKVPTKVHNLTVGETQSYFAAGFASHNCQCQLGRVPEGWGFDSEGQLTPGGTFGLRYGSEQAAQKALAAEDSLRKALVVRGRIDYQGLPIAIENPIGSVRRWRAKDGTPGETTMSSAYGYIEGTMGSDGDEYDVFLGPDPQAPMVFIMHQRQEDADEWDEDKAMLGFCNPHMAQEAYLAHYTDSHFLHSMTVMPIEEFRAKIYATMDPGSFAADGMLKSSLLPSLALANTTIEDRMVSGTGPNYLAQIKPHEYERKAEPIPVIQLLDGARSPRRVKKIDPSKMGSREQPCHPVQIPESLHELHEGARDEVPEQMAYVKEMIGRRVKGAVLNQADVEEEKSKNKEGTRFVVPLDLEKAQQGRSGGHKYIRRTGVPGSYKYEYISESTSRRSSGPKEETKPKWTLLRHPMWIQKQLTMFPTATPAAPPKQWREFHEIPAHIPPPLPGSWTPGQRGGTEALHWDHSQNRVNERRAELHRSIIDAFRGGKEPPSANTRPLAIVTMGGPASGKSTLLQKFYSREETQSFVQIDSDLVKAQLPEYRQAIADGYKSAASLVHGEATGIVDSLRHETVSAGQNLIFDSTGADLELFLAKIQMMKNRGYRVVVLMPYLDEATALRRARKRGEEEGRWVHDAVVQLLAQELPNNFASIAALADEAHLVDNSVGPPPKAIYSKHGDSHQIHDDRLLDKFAGLRKLAESGVAKAGESQSEIGKFLLRLFTEAAIEDAKERPKRYDVSGGNVYIDTIIDSVTGRGLQ